jgi:hypothetical protein
MIDTVPDWTDRKQGVCIYFLFRRSLLECVCVHRQQDSPLVNRRRSKEIYFARRRQGCRVCAWRREAAAAVIAGRRVPRGLHERASALPCSGPACAAARQGRSLGLWVSARVPRNKSGITTSLALWPRAALAICHQHVCRTATPESRERYLLSQNFLFTLCAAERQKKIWNYGNLRRRPHLWRGASDPRSLCIW